MHGEPAVLHAAGTLARPQPCVPEEPPTFAVPPVADAPAFALEPPIDDLPPVAAPPVDLPPVAVDVAEVVPPTAFVPPV